MILTRSIITEDKDGALRSASRGDVPSDWLLAWYPITEDGSDWLLAWYPDHGGWFWLAVGLVPRSRRMGDETCGSRGHGAVVRRLCWCDRVRVTVISFPIRVLTGRWGPWRRATRPAGHDHRPQVHQVGGAWGLWTRQRSRCLTVDLAVRWTAVYGAGSNLMQFVYTMSRPAVSVPFNRPRPVLRFCVNEASHVFL